jgi:hypothetical protein
MLRNGKETTGRSRVAQEAVTMNKLAVLSLSAPLLLIGAAYPKVDKSAEVYDDAGAYADAGGYPDEAPVAYRPCRPGPGDDHCIQLYERGVRASYARWLRHHDAGERPREVAMGGPDEPVMHARHRRDHADMRCDDGDEARGM